MIGISQSGESPDVRAVIEEARRQGRPTIAITNRPDRRSARAAEAVLPLEAGEELAVAATKTYLNSLGAVALLFACVDRATSEALRELELMPGADRRRSSRGRSRTPRSLELVRAASTAGRSSPAGSTTAPRSRSR